ncbi:MAG: hypothetical protein SFX73_04255 [Kofleriaceae bacterium]|nr:hypothetical protein [Kofleriaceae bacterium]
MPLTLSETSKPTRAPGASVHVPRPRSAARTNASATKPELVPKVAYALDDHAPRPSSGIQTEPSRRISPSLDGARRMSCRVQTLGVPRDRGRIAGAGRQRIAVAPLRARHELGGQAGSITPSMAGTDARR